MSGEVERGGWSTGTLVALLLWPVLVVTVAVLWVRREVAAQIAARPPVVFIDELEAVRRAPAGGTPEARAQAAVARARTAGQQLADAGYLVLDRRAVYASPADLEVQP